MLAMAELLHSDPEKYQLGDVIEMKAENVAEVRDEAHKLFAVAHAAWQAATGQAATDAPAYPAASEGRSVRPGVGARGRRRHRRRRDVGTLRR